MRRNIRFFLVIAANLICAISFSQIFNPATTAAPRTQTTTDTLPENIIIDSSLTNILNQPTSKKYTLAGVLVSGNNTFDRNLISNISGLIVGTTVSVPGGDEISKGIKKLWSQNAFSEIRVYLVRRVNENLFIEINVTERPRLSRFVFRGISKTQADELKSKTGLVPGRAINQNMKLTAVDAIKRYYNEKGFRNLTIDIEERPDSTVSNAVQLIFNIDRGSKVKIDRIGFYENDEIEGGILKRKMKDTKEMNRFTLFPSKTISPWGEPNEYTWDEYVDDLGFFTYTRTRRLLDKYVKFSLNASKFNEKKYADDKQKILDYYNSLGYRDAQIMRDTVYYNDQNHLKIDIEVNEGHKYYFGDITWRGNTKYSDSLLASILGIYKGDIYNAELLEKKLNSAEEWSVSKLYQDVGHLRFSANPVERSIYNDTIDFEITLREGPVYTIKNVTISGNEKTNEHVLRREIRTLPGEKWNRDLLMRSYRQLASLPYINPEKINPVPNPDDENGTVDINYGVEEKSADQIELSAGFGGGIGFTGTLGLTFSNFSINNIFNKKGWDPLPTGDGQQLNVRFQTNGKMYSSYSVSFVEPWLGGKNPNALSVSFFRTKYAPYESPIYSSNFRNPYLGYNTTPIDTNVSFATTTLGVGYSRALRWPDDYFRFGVQANLTRYDLTNYEIDRVNLPFFKNGVSNNFNLKFTLERNSLDNPLYTRSGSHLYASAQLTPPYSLFNKSLQDLALNDPKKFKWIEYQKYRFGGDWYLPLSRPRGEDNKQLVFRASVKLGYIGNYNSNMPVSPFERFQLGDAGMSNTYQFFGYDIISHRGYPVYESSNPRFNPDQNMARQYFTIFNKYTAELRYPLTLAQSSTIYGLAFFEAANGWYNFKEYNPFKLRRSVGLGARFFLPMFGLLGFDYGIGLDRVTPGGGLKGAGKFTFMMGMQPD